MPLDHHGRCGAQEATPDNEVQHDRSVAPRLAEARQGFELWRSITRVVCLTVNVRAPGVLSRLQAEMRSGTISDDMWNLYMSRVLQPGDLRLQDPSLPFFNNEIHFIVHRHRIRTMRSMDHAKEYSNLHEVPLYIVQARDEVVRSDDAAKLTPQLRASLLQRVNPDDTSGLPGFFLCIAGCDCYCHQRTVYVLAS